MAPNPDVSPHPSPRLPPGQRPVRGLPVLHYGGVPRIDPRSWSLRVFGLVEAEKTFTYDEILSLPSSSRTVDIHCVTGWSRLDAAWTGIPVGELLRRAPPSPAATHVLVHASGDWSTNLPIADFSREDVLLAHSFDGKPLTPDHGYPLRLVVPHLYFWKSAKWLTGIEFAATDVPGFWEKAGYHLRGDPWKEERYRDDPAWLLDESSDRIPSLFSTGGPIPCRERIRNLFREIGGKAIIRYNNA